MEGTHVRSLNLAETDLDGLVMLRPVNTDIISAFELRIMGREVKIRRSVAAKVRIARSARFLVAELHGLGVT